MAKRRRQGGSVDRLTVDLVDSRVDSASETECDPVGRAGPPVQPGRNVPLPKQRIRGGDLIGEYFDDVMLVNGKVWPFLEVEPRLYRFRILNGCNARILSLDIGGPKLWQIGAEGGMWDQPVPVKELVLAPRRARRPAGRLQHLPRRPTGNEESQPEKTRLDTHHWSR
jgi:hypothetical protein